MTVSYTHLDVYKRQALVSSADKQSCYTTWFKDIINAISLKLIYNYKYITAVSYTHLDVYKRQILSHPHYVSLTYKLPAFYSFHRQVNLVYVATWTFYLLFSVNVFFVSDRQLSAFCSLCNIASTVVLIIILVLTFVLHSDPTFEHLK